MHVAAGGLFSPPWAISSDNQVQTGRRPFARILWFLIEFGSLGLLSPLAVTNVRAERAGHIRDPDVLEYAAGGAQGKVRTNLTADVLAMFGHH